MAWDAKVVCSTYWVYSHQVSKTAPTGEYLSVGSFMIRGKKNFLPPSHLILGLGFLFKLEDSSIERHRNDRTIKSGLDDDNSSVVETNNEQLESIVEDEEEIAINNSDSDDESVEEKKSSDVEEETNLEEENSFPDIQIKIEHNTKSVDIQHDSIGQKEDESEETLIQAIPMKAKKYEKKMKPQKKKGQKTSDVPVAPVQAQVQDNKSNKNAPKRGQKGKLKKIKEKYKDQDEEDRAIAMEILQSSGTSKDTPATAATSSVEKAESENQKTKKNLIKPQNVANDDDLNVAAADETDMLDSLTGCPIEDDELLFAMPVVAPYQTLQNYK